MNKYRKPVYNEDNLGVNPFVENLSIVVNSVEFKQQYKKDKDGHWVNVIGELEADTSCRVYNSSDRRIKMSRLSSSAKGLLLWIIYEADSGKDYLWLNRVRYQEENNIKSMNTYRSAVNELIDTGFVCRSKVGGVYFINPALFFNGNRVNKFSENVVRR